MKHACDFLPVLKELHERIRDAVVDACERSAIAALSGIAKEEEGDTIYTVDKISEDVLVEFVECEIAPYTSVVLIAEGIKGGKIFFPADATEDTALWRIIVDPIDGTRGLMYQKRSAWILTGVAKNRGVETSLADIEFAIQTEIPLVKQHMSDILWAERGRGAVCERFDRVRNEYKRMTLTPSASETIAHGFASMTRFFAGVGEEVAAVYEEVVESALGPVKVGKAHCFEDQYISTGGQLYELMAGHDRFIADLRPLFERSLASRGLQLGICCHPYDLCTELIAREFGVIVTDEEGDPVNAVLAVEPDIAWVGYANAKIRAQIEPHLQRSLKARRLIGQKAVNGYDV